MLGCSVSDADSDTDADLVWTRPLLLVDLYTVLVCQPAFDAWRIVQYRS